MEDLPYEIREISFKLIIFRFCTIIIGRESLLTHKKFELLSIYKDWQRDDTTEELAAAPHRRYVLQSCGSRQVARREIPKDKDFDIAIQL